MSKEYVQWLLNYMADNPVTFEELTDEQRVLVFKALNDCWKAANNV